MRKVQWGIIGCGGIARRRTIPGLLLADNAQCCAIMSARTETVDAVGDEFNISNRYTDLDEFLARPDIDAVYIASPLYCHKEHVFAAAKAGKHILLEKPMGLTASEAEEMVQFCQSQNVKLGVGFMMRYHGGHEKIRSIISEGGIGEVVYAHGIFHCDAPAQNLGWRQTKAQGGGGAMMDLGVHCIDLLQNLTGLRAKAVSGFCANQIHTYPDVEDAATAVMKMENGAIFSVSANFNIPSNAGLSNFRIYGTKGSIIAEATMRQVETGTVYYRSADKPGEAPEIISYDTKNMYTKQIEAFSDAILRDVQPPVSGQDGVFVQRIVEAVYDNAQRENSFEL